LLKKRIIITLTFLNGVLFRTKKFKPDYRYTKNFIDLWSIDELILIDISEKKFSKNFLDLIAFFSKNCFVPISVGGGIATIENADIFFKNGADKIVLGSNSINKKDLIEQISKKYGNQSIIQSVDCKKILKDNTYVVMGSSGTENLLQNPIEFSIKALAKGVGEIMINNIDNDGSLMGYDIDLIKLVSKKINCPILALGGAGNWQHILDLLSKTDISAACTQNIFHFTEESILSAKKFLKDNNIKVRS
jgi:imidazole glycerol-phosphate synthase subunit HisF